MFTYKETIKMPTETNEAQKYIKILCSSIDELIKAWHSARELSYRISPNEPGSKANYCAIKLGLATNEKDWPFINEEWWYDSSPKKAQEKWPDRPKELQTWKERAIALEPKTKIRFLPIDINVTNEKIEKFIRIADEVIDILKHSSYLNLVGNKDFIIKGKVLNELSLELDLIDPDWYLAKYCNLLKTYAFGYNPPKDKENFLKVYEELGINPYCKKQPFIIYNDLTHDGYINEDELQALLVSAKSLLKPETDMIPPEFKTSPTTLTRLVDLWGGDMTLSKLRGIIKNKRIRFNRLNRQTYIFDTRDLPISVINGLKE